MLTIPPACQLLFGQDRKQEINLEWPKRYWSYFKALVTYFEPPHADQSEKNNNNIHMYMR